MITWKFNDLAITFRSTEANLARDISKMAWANNIEPDAKITILDGTTNNNLSADGSGSDGYSCPTAQSTLPKRTKTPTVPEPEAVQLPTVSGDVDDVNPESDLLDILDSFGDTGESGNWLDSKPDGQDTH
jgi:hypothetical protein